MSAPRPRLLLVAALSGVVACSDYEVESLRRVEVFQQEGEVHAADVLFVVDDSPSMGEEQALLAQNFLAFVEVLGATYADWQIGVVTTDVSSADAGRLRGGILTPETPDLAAAFEAAVAVGDEGSRDEQGIFAAVLAADPSRNPNFLRPESRFNVVFVSDEDDHSTESVQTYIQALQDASGLGGFGAHALVGPLPAGCVSGTTAASPGSRYLEMVELLDGWYDSICADSYTPLLVQVGLDVAGWNTVFALGNLPAPETIVVMVDGVTIPEREVDGWTYSYGQNAIVFTGRAVPRPGMAVTVEYSPWVGPQGDSGP